MGTVMIMLTFCHELIHWKQYQDGEEFDEEEAYTGETELYNQYIAHSKTLH